MPAAGKTPDLDLSSFELSFANAADPLVLERIPFPESISRTQERQSIVKLNINCHNTRSILRLALKQTIGTPDD